MNKILTIKNTLILFIILSIGGIIAGVTGNDDILEPLMPLYLIVPVLLMIAFLREKKEIKKRDSERKKVMTTNNNVMNKQNNNDDLIISNKRHKLFLTIAFIGVLLSPILKNTSFGFIANYGGMLLSGATVFQSLERKNKNKTYSKIMILVAMIILLTLLILNVMFYQEQFSSYKEIQNY